MWVSKSIGVLIQAALHVLRHSVSQFEARICLSVSQIQPQSMFKICFSKNIHKSKFHDLVGES